MISDGRPFDTNVFFSGGAGMFIQYHDIVKPAYLFAIVKMMITNESFGLPIHIIKDMSVPSLIEWYMQRRFKNPLRCLDFHHQLDQDVLDRLMHDVLVADDSIYRLAAPLNVVRMFSVYTRQHMSFPVYIYSEEEEPYIRTDCQNLFPGISTRYVHGDLRTCIKLCDQNFTYIFSDIELVKKASEILLGTMSHILLAQDYRYNYVDGCKTFRYGMKKMMDEHPYVRLGTTVAVDPLALSRGIHALSRT